MLALSERGKKRLAYGFWRYTEDRVAEAIAVLSQARASGIDHFDTADIYGGASGYGGAEKLLGAVRQQAPELLDGAVIATKAGCDMKSPYCSSPSYLKTAVDGSLSRLRIGRIDLFYVHRPDLLAHPADVAGALDDLVAAGKIAAVGVSNYTPAQVEALTRYLKAPLKAHQIEFSPGFVDPLFDGTLDQAMTKDFAIAAWSPLAGGRLAENGPEQYAPVRQVLARLATEHGVSPTAIALAFLLKHPACVTPILGTTKPERLREALAALEITLSPRQWYDIVEASRGKRMP